MRPLRLSTWSMQRCLIGAVVLVVLGMAACGPPYLQEDNETVLVDEEGNQIRLEGIEKIVNNEDLTDQQKREELEALGITDDVLIDLLIGGL